MRKVSLLGRGAGRDAIAALLTSAADGRGGAYWLAGDPGLGKTTLLRAAASSAAGHSAAGHSAAGHSAAGHSAAGSGAAGFTVLSCAGTEDEAGLPFAGLRQLLAGEKLPDALRSAVDGQPAQHRLALSLETVDVLASLRQPVLCCVDDAQWLDRETVDVLRFAARRIGTLPVAILFASTEPAPRDVPGTRLAPLDHAASVRVLTESTGGERLAGDVAAVLATLASGNPAALVELATALTAEQRTGAAPPPTGLPSESDLRRRYRGRLAGLPDATRRLLLLAATDADLSVPEFVAAARTGGQDLADLAPAERAGLVEVTGERVAFRQPLLASVVYDESPLAERRAAHEHVAAAARSEVRRQLHLATIAGRPDDERADALAEAAAATEPGIAHELACRALDLAAELTSDPGTAAARWVAAARRAWLGGQPYRARLLLRRIPPRTAPAHLRGASELLLGEIELRAGATASARCALLDAAYQLTEQAGSLDASRPRPAPFADGDRYLAVSALMLAGEALCRSGYHERFAGIARQALELRRGDEPLAAQFLFEHFTGLAALIAGDQYAAVRPLRRVITLAGQLDEPVPLVRASLAGIVLGDDLEAHRLATRAVRLARATGDRAALPQALEYVAVADFALGNYAAASASALDGMRLAREYGQDAVGADQLALLAVLAGMVGDWPTCAARARQAQASPSLDEAGQGWALSEWALSLLDLAEGRVRQATDRLFALVGTGGGRGHPIIQMAATPHLVEAAARCGDRGAARTAAKAFDGWARSTGNPTWLALSARSQALVAEHEDEAEEYFHEALRQHQSGDAPFLRARTEQMYGQELRRRRRPAAARQYFRNALETFQRFDATWWIDQVCAELRAAGDQVNPARRTGDSDALTAQQLQIARMVAEGATNREIAAQLFLSPRTVDHHMRNIFARLNIRSRTELVKLMA